MKNSLSYQIALPDWMEEFTRQLPAAIPQLEDRMELVIQLSQLNIDRQTGGPFAAAVFETLSGRLVALGVNRVVPSNNSTAHAEIVALSLAQQQLGTYDLGSPALAEHQLVVNAWPCAMCLGSIAWSGVTSLVTAANGTQVESISGFDEGPVHPQWQHELAKRGIEVVDGILSEAACAVLHQFAASGAPVYNARSRQR